MFTWFVYKKKFTQTLHPSSFFYILCEIIIRPAIFQFFCYFPPFLWAGNRHCLLTCTLRFSCMYCFFQLSLLIIVCPLNRGSTCIICCQNDDFSTSRLTPYICYLFLVRMFFSYSSFTLIDDIFNHNNEHELLIRCTDYLMPAFTKRE